MSLVFGAICPHPPIIIPQIGKNELEKVKKTINSLIELESRLVQSKPDVILIVSPHGHLEADRFNILGDNDLSGNFGQFGNEEIELNFRNDTEIAGLIKEEADINQIPVNIIKSNSLDHGMLVPLFYLTSNGLDNLPIIGMGFSFLAMDIHFKLGQLIGKVVKKTKKRIAFIASGDLSHRLNKNAPAGYTEEGEKFDQQLIKLIKDNAIKEILNIDPVLVDKAGECGLRSIIMLLGSLTGLNYTPEILSYEGPFGVGYLVANFKIK